MRSIALLPLLLLLALPACGKQVINRPQEVDIPISVPCKTQKPPEPKWAVAALSATATATDRLKAVLADLRSAKGYIIQLSAAVDACNA